MKTFFSLLVVFLILTGCTPSTSPLSFEHESGIYFGFPDGWSQLSKKEWRERDMGPDNTLITIMDENREAGFSLIPVGLKGSRRIALTTLGSEAAAKAAMVIASVDAAGPRKYQEYSMLSKGATVFAGFPMAELVFQGRNPGKTLKWYRLLALTSDSDEALLMFVFTAPLGEESGFEEDFSYIEDTWRWDDTSL